MIRMSPILAAAAALAAIWLAVAGVRHWAGSHRATAARTARLIADARIDDWSSATPDSPAEAARRESRIREIAGVVNHLDFAERETTRNEHTLEDFYRRLNAPERRLFVDLTIRESMNQFMAALDAMKPAERRKFVEQGLREIEKGRTAEEMTRAKQMDAELLDRITGEGMRAYFEKADSATKLDLAPLMEAMNETMKGLRGQEFPSHGS